MFSLGSTAPRTRVHTPMSYRAARRLHFSSPSPGSSPWASSVPPLPSASTTVSPASLPPELRTDPADGNSYDLLSFISVYGGTITSPPFQWLSATPAVSIAASTVPMPRIMTPTPAGASARSAHDFVLPWGDEINNRIKALFKFAPPKLVYPSGSRDEDVNKRFITRMDQYLSQSFIVRRVIIGERKHPFAEYPRLNQYWQSHGYPDYTFDTT